jgi:hypothetical protein
MNNSLVGMALVLLSAVPLAWSAYLMFVATWNFHSVMQSIWMILFALMLLLLGNHVSARGSREIQRPR